MKIIVASASGWGILLAVEGDEADNETNKNMKAAEQTNLETTLRAYEAAHARWMKTPVFAPNANSVKAEKESARMAYEAAYKAANPSHGII